MINCFSMYSSVVNFELKSLCLISNQYKIYRTYIMKLKPKYIVIFNLKPHNYIFKIK